MEKIQVKSFEPKDGLKISHRKENAFDSAYIAIDRAGKIIAELRFYWPASNVYACFWVHYADRYANGGGSAGGGGYDKRSAAAENAFNAAGLQLSRSIHGTGEQMQAMEAIGRKLAGRRFLTVIKTHG